MCRQFVVFCFYYIIIKCGLGVVVFFNYFRLPVAHTCFNQLCLPPYKNKKELKQKLIIGISNAEGFGLE